MMMALERINCVLEMCNSDLIEISKGMCIDVNINMTVSKFMLGDYQ